MKNIAWFAVNRAELGLILPVVKEMERSEVLEPLRMTLAGVDDPMPQLGEIYNQAYRALQIDRPDLVFLGFDRYEALMVALAAYHLNIPLAQLEAGDISLKGSWDDWTRHAISLYSTYHFTNGSESKKVVCNLLESIGRSTEHVYDVGSTAFDDIQREYEGVPLGGFTLVLYNAPTRRPEVILDELGEIEKLLDAKTFWIGPNGDPGSQLIIDYVQDLMKRNLNIEYHDNIPRPKFLALMSRCDRYIGNSSSLFKEAPEYLPRSRIVHIGVRNKGREYVKPIPGASRRIVEILEGIL